MSLGILIGLAAGTLVSEDLASISGGLLARNGVIGLLPAIAACVTGVYVGDLGLWAIGRFLGDQGLRHEWVARRLRGVAIDVGNQIDANIASAVLASRLVPGSRLPMYLAVGACGRRPWTFAGWSLVAVLLWTPLLVWLTYTLGAAATARLVGGLTGAVQSVLAATLIFLSWTLASRWIGRRRSVVNQRACEVT